jgi:hypothetical protein
LQILGEDGDALGVNGAQIGILKESDQVCFRGFLERHDGSCLKPQFILEILCNFTNEALEGQLAEEEVGALLVLADLAEGDGAGAKATRGRRVP